MGEALLRMGELIRERKPSYIVTPNADTVVKTQKDPDFRRIYEKAALALPDGMSQIWAGYFLGTPFKEKVSGSDFFVEACRAASRNSWRVFLLGARPGIAEQAANILQKKMQDLKVAGTYSPSFGFESKVEENERIVKMIQQAKPDIVFVGLGSPKQEKWMDKYKDVCGVPG
jgi:exopolysaccharide biosynthesis WecB/TagA/CpsF family protein